MGGGTQTLDALVKLLVQGAEGPLRQLNLGPVTEWLNVDLPRTQNRRVDLLGKLPDGRLLHIELQSTNDRTMPFRMAEYALAILRRYGQYPVQLLIYVGNPRLRMKSEFRTEGMTCRYRQVDIRSLDAAALLAGDRIEDNILAVLAGSQDSAGGIRAVLRKIAKLKRPLRQEALHNLLLTCGVRGLSKVYERELKEMPITMDLSHDPLFAEYLERGRAKGEKQGLREGQKKGLLEGQKKGLLEGQKQGLREGQKIGLREGQKMGAKQLVKLLLEKRFGPLPPAITKRLTKLSEAQTQKLALATVDAKCLDELFPEPRR